MSVCLSVVVTPLHSQPVSQSVSQPFLWASILILIKRAIRRSLGRKRTQKHLKTICWTSDNRIITCVHSKTNEATAQKPRDEQLIKLIN